jgi:hypothetical protein
MNVTTANNSGQGETNMSIFTIDADTHITAYTTTQEASQAGAGLTQFDSQDELTRISTEWPLSRLVDVWNSIPGNGKVNKFQDLEGSPAVGGPQPN